MTSCIIVSGHIKLNGNEKKTGKEKISAEQWLVLISEKLKELRREDSTSYENFAMEHGLDRKQYWRIENGANITVRTLIQTLEIHNIDIVTFFKDIEMPKKTLSKS